MKNILKAITLLLSSLLIIDGYAASAPGEIEVLEASGTSLNLDWEDVEGVLGYYIYYGETSGSGSDYDIEGVDLIDESNFLLENLKSETRYFIAVSSVDEFGSESEYSPELSYETLQVGSELSAASFRVVEASAIDDRSIEIKFSVDLEEGSNAQRQFIIENVATSEELGVDISDLIPGDPTSVVALLDGELLANTQYKVTVLEIRDASENTIESGIDAFVNFTTPLVFSSDLEAAGAGENESNSEGTTEENSENIAEDESLNESPNLNAAGQLEGNNAGTTISTAGTTAQAAQDNEKLPQTGPEHWVLAFIALLLAGGFYFRSSKK